MTLPNPSARAKVRKTAIGADDGWFGLAKGLGMKFRLPGGRAAALDKPALSDGPKVGVPIRGLRNDIPVTLDDGGAVPGDRVVGILDGGGGIHVFQIHSPKLQDYESANWIDVTWDVDPAKPERFPARISVTATNAPGTLAKIAFVIGEADGNIDSVRMVRRAPDFTEMLIDLEVYNVTHLNDILIGLKEQEVVSAAERVFG